MGIPKIGLPQIIQVIIPWISFETHDDLGYHHNLGKAMMNPCCIYICKYDLALFHLSSNFQ